MRRVVVTGIGVLSALGLNREQFFESLCIGRSGIGPITARGCTGLRAPNGAEVKDFRAADHFEPKSADMLDRFTQFAVVAAREAVGQSALAWSDELCGNAAIV